MKRIILIVYVLAACLLTGIGDLFKGLAIGWDMAKKWKKNE